MSITKEYLKDEYELFKEVKFFLTSIHFAYYITVFYSYKDSGLNGHQRGKDFKMII